MRRINREPLKYELRQSIVKPWRLPRNMVLAAMGTFAGIGVGIIIHSFHRGLPYIAADVFVWTLATYNASQLGSDSDRVLEYSKNKDGIKELLLIKNLTLLIIALPIDTILVIIACSILGDWSKFWESILLATSSVIICLGLGNLVSVLWVYRPVSFLKMRKDRLLMFEYAIFIAISYVAATLAIALAMIPGEIILKTVKIHTLHGAIIGISIMIGWAIVLWILALIFADRLSNKYHDFFINRLNGNKLAIKNPRMKKILKVT